MWIESELYEQDLTSILEDINIDWSRLKNKNILITGATGLIGSVLVNSFMFANINKNLNMNVYAMVRDIEKAEKMFRHCINSEIGLFFVESDILHIVDCEFDIDYIIHTASPTSSKDFVDFPVETIDSIFLGTKKILEIAKKKKATFVFLSTMEVYGTPLTDEKIDENHHNNLDTTMVRNCYPISKRMVENLCVCYCEEYGVDVKIVRLTQTFGPGVQYNDGRVFAEFARCVLENKDIILRTKGETKRSYLYTADAVRAIIIIMLNGDEGAAYNVANDETYCSIFEMATLVSKVCTNDKIKVVFDLSSDLSRFGYAPTLHMNLNTEKIKKLGWKPYYGLSSMFQRLCESMKEISS